MLNLVVVLDLKVDDKFLEELFVYSECYGKMCVLN